MQLLDRTRLQAQTSSDALTCHAGGTNPLQDPLMRHLQLHRATSRSVAALVITAWVKTCCQAQERRQNANSLIDTAAVLADPASCFPYQETMQAMTWSLATAAVVQHADGSVEPFAELASLYALMRQHAQVQALLLAECLCPHAPALLYVAQILLTHPFLLLLCCSLLLCTASILTLMYLHVGRQ